MSSRYRSNRPGNAGRSKAQCGCSKHLCWKLFWHFQQRTIAPMRAGTKPPPQPYEPALTAREPSIHLCTEVQLPRPPRVGSWLRPILLSGWRGMTCVQTWCDPGNSMVFLRWTECGNFALCPKRFSRILRLNDYFEIVFVGVVWTRLIYWISQTEDKPNPESVTKLSRKTTLWKFKFELQTKFSPRF
jgi:hypothetical protein